MRRLMLVALAFVPTLSLAQMTNISPGTLIRVTAPSALAGRVEGLLVEATADSLILMPQSGITFRLPNSVVSRVEVRRRTRSAGAKKFGLVSAIATLPFGILMGGVAGGGACDYSNPETIRLADADSLRFCPRTPTKASNVIGFAAVVTISGALQGALIGAMVGASEWKPVSIPVRVSSTRQGLRIGTSISF